MEGPLGQSSASAVAAVLVGGLAYVSGAGPLTILVAGFAATALAGLRA